MLMMRVNGQLVAGRKIKIVRKTETMAEVDASK